MRAKPGELKMQWSKREADMQYMWGGGGAKSADGALLHYALGSPRMYRNYDKGGEIDFERSLLEELEARGYDLATLRFSIRKRESPPPTPTTRTGNP